MQMRGVRFAPLERRDALGRVPMADSVAGLFVEGVTETTAVWCDLHGGEATRRSKSHQTRGHPSIKETTAKHELNTHDARSGRVGVCR